MPTQDIVRMLCPFEPPASDECVARDTRQWVERAVIGLNLCPFAKAVHVKGQIHYAVSDATAAPALLRDVVRELDDLLALEPAERETTLLMAPRCLHEFLEFNDFLRQAQRLISRRGLVGEIQLASFHPGYQFAGTEVGDITNFSNRSPYPTLHLLREASVGLALEGFPRPDAIYTANMETLRRLGLEGWTALCVGRS